MVRRFRRRARCLLHRYADDDEPGGTVPAGSGQARPLDVDDDGTSGLGAGGNRQQRLLSGAGHLSSKRPGLDRARRPELSVRYRPVALRQLFDLVRADSGTNQFGSPFKPTTGEGAEIGVKFKPVGSNLMLTAAVFEVTQQNVLTTDPATSTSASRPAKSACAALNSRHAAT